MMNRINYVVRQGPVLFHEIGGKDRHISRRIWSQERYAEGEKPAKKER